MISVCVKFVGDMGILDFHGVTKTIRVTNDRVLVSYCLEEALKEIVQESSSQPYVFIIDDKCIHATEIKHHLISSPLSTVRNAFNYSSGGRMNTLYLNIGICNEKLFRLVLTNNGATIADITLLYQKASGYIIRSMINKTKIVLYGHIKIMLRCVAYGGILAKNINDIIDRELSLNSLEELSMLGIEPGKYTADISSLPVKIVKGRTESLTENDAPPPKIFNTSSPAKMKFSELVNKKEYDSIYNNLTADITLLKSKIDNVTDTCQDYILFKRDICDTISAIKGQYETFSIVADNMDKLVIALENKYEIMEKEIGELKITNKKLQEHIDGLEKNIVADDKTPFIENMPHGNTLLEIQDSTIDTFQMSCRSLMAELKSHMY